MARIDIAHFISSSGPFAMRMLTQQIWPRFRRCLSVPFIFACFLLTLTLAAKQWTEHQDVWLRGVGPGKHQWHANIADDGLWWYWVTYQGSDDAFAEFKRCHPIGGTDWTKSATGIERQSHYDSFSRIGPQTPTFPRYLSIKDGHTWTIQNHESATEPCLQANVDILTTEFVLPFWIIQTPLVAFIAFIVWRRARIPEKGRCIGCGYLLVGNASGQCPECGKMIAEIAAEATIQVAEQS